MGVKRIKDMLRTRQFGDVKLVEMVVYLRGRGFDDKGGRKHIKMERREGRGRRVLIIPRNNPLRKDQVRDILKKAGII